MNIEVTTVNSNVDFEAFIRLLVKKFEEENEK